MFILLFFYQFFLQYTIIQKAIDPGYGETTPGYVYEELIQLSYEGNLAEGLASNLVSHLGNTKVKDVEKQLKVLKTLYTISTKGSRLFRHSLRKPNNDEHLRAAAKRGNNSSSQFASPGGTSKEDQIRKLATVDIFKYIKNFKNQNNIKHAYKI